VLEACGAAHHWARVLTGLGHDVKLIAPEAVKPFVKKGLLGCSIRCALALPTTERESAGQGLRRHSVEVTGS